MSIIAAFERQFDSIDTRSRHLLTGIPEDLVYSRPRPLERELTPFSCGEYILRSSAMVETVFNGITRRLWDDPFEWTLPEKISTKSAVLDYLDDVKRARVEGFRFLVADSDLEKVLPAPEEFRSLADILLEAIARSEHYLGRSVAIYQMLISEKPPVL